MRNETTAPTGLKRGLRCVKSTTTMNARGAQRPICLDKTDASENSVASARFQRKRPVNALQKNKTG